MTLDPLSIYGLMLRSRLFEDLTEELWHAGGISGELHLSRGEEAVCAAVISQLQEDDAMALDHRGTAPMIMRGVSAEDLLKECMGLPGGLCDGNGGHMHLFDKGTLSASSGIVGASGPACVGFALAAQVLRPGSVAVAFFGDGAMNQGMLLEALNLAATWNLPCVFICKDNGWAITTKSQRVTAGELTTRSIGLGVPAERIDGLDAMEVGSAAERAIDRARSGGGPSLLLCKCSRLSGHFLGDPLIRAATHPVSELPGMSASLVKAAVRSGGGGISQRARAVADITGLVGQTAISQAGGDDDPVKRMRRKIGDKVALKQLESNTQHEMEELKTAAFVWMEKAND